MELHYTFLYIFVVYFAKNIVIYVGYVVCDCVLGKRASIYCNFLFPTPEYEY
jgi:hypothetical protein